MGVPLGHVAGALLVTHEDVADRRVEQRVVRGEDAATWVAEHRVDSLHLERPDQRLCAGDPFTFDVLRRCGANGLSNVALASRDD